MIVATPDLDLDPDPDPDRWVEAVAKELRGAAVQVATTVQQTGGFLADAPMAVRWIILITVNTTAPRTSRTSTPSPPYLTSAVIPAASFFPAAVFMPFAAPGLTGPAPAAEKEPLPPAAGGSRWTLCLHAAVLSSA